MNKTLIEIIGFLKEEFPKTNEKVFIKIIFSLKSRYNLYGNGNIGLSRKEYINYGVSEAQLLNIIMCLRNYGLIKKVGTIKFNNKVQYNYCNIYEIADFFLDMLKDLEFFTKKVFEYINPITFIQKYFKFTFKNGLYKFKHNGYHYNINTRGNFKNKIYCGESNKLINPLTLLQ